MSRQTEIEEKIMNNEEIHRTHQHCTNCGQSMIFPHHGTLLWVCKRCMVVKGLSYYVEKYKKEQKNLPK